MSCVKKVLALHDMSGFGRCALTVVVPVLSSFGIQAVPVPTAVLSTHTGGFDSMAFLDLTDFMKDTLRHYKTLDLSFDSIYTGFLGSEEQADVVKEYISTFKTNENVVIVDPAFADDGKLYSTITKGMVSEMQKLISEADLITPNYTEAMFLLEESMKNNVSYDSAVKSVKKLSKFGPEYTVVTGIPCDEKILTVGYNKKNDDIISCFSERAGISYPGCGDLFASCLCGHMLSGSEFEKGVQCTVSFIDCTIDLAVSEGDAPRNGIPFEKFLKKLGKT